MGEPRPEARLIRRHVWSIAAALWLAVLALGAMGISSFLGHEHGQLSRGVVSRCFSTLDGLNQIPPRTLEAMQRVHSPQQGRVPFSDPMGDAPGSLDGVFIVSLDPFLLAPRLGAASAGEGNILALMRVRDGALLTGSRAAEAQAPQGALANHLAVVALRAEPLGSFLTPSTIDGRELLICFRRLPERELLLVAAEEWTNLSQPFQALQRWAWWSFALTMLLLLLLGRQFAALRSARLPAARRMLVDAEADHAASTAAWDRLEHLLQAAPVAIYAGRVAGDGLGHTPFRTGFASPNITRVIGWEAEVFLDPDRARMHMEAPAWEARTEFFRRILAEGPDVLEYRWRWPDGSWRWLREEARRVGPDIVGSLLDVTAQREAAGWAAASARLNMLGEIAANMTHELNQPLAVISLAADNASAALEIEGAAGIPDALETLDLVVQQAARCKAVVQHLRLFSNPGQREALALMQVETVLQGTMLLMRGVLRDAGITLHNQLPDALPAIRANAVGVQEVFVNLFLNARDALARLPAGAPREIWITAWQEDGMLRTRFADSGGGIPPEFVHRVFEPFFTTKGGDKGSGLGLAICQSAMRGFGGDIRVRSGAVGAEFTLDFPLAEPKAAQDSKAP